MKKKVLWIEDQGLTDLDVLASYVYLSGEYDLDVAVNVSECLSYLRQREYDIIIFDIRIPPGENLDWRKLFDKLGGNEKNAKLGLQLLRSLLKHSKAEISTVNIPNWISPNRIGVLTIEPNLNNDMAELGIKSYIIKNSDSNPEILLKIINGISNNSI
jgi:hypothetical protein